MRYSRKKIVAVRMILMLLLFSTTLSVMRSCIHRGTREIGGTCIEVESQGKRLA